MDVEVTNQLGEPVIGATLVKEGGDMTFDFEAGDVTDSDGKFSIDDEVQEGETFEIKVTPPDGYKEVMAASGTFGAPAGGDINNRETISITLPVGQASVSKKDFPFCNN